MTRQKTPWKPASFTVEGILFKEVAKSQWHGDYRGELVTLSHMPRKKAVALYAGACGPVRAPYDSCIKVAPQKGSCAWPEADLHQAIKAAKLHIRERRKMFPWLRPTRK